MNCAEFENLLDTGAIRPDKLPEKAAGHIRSCPSCKAALHDLSFADKIFKAARCRLDDELRVSIMDSIMKLPLPSGGNVIQMNRTSAANSNTRAEARRFRFLSGGYGLVLAAMAACVAVLIIYPGLFGTVVRETGWSVAEVQGEIFATKAGSIHVVTRAAGTLASETRLACTGQGAVTLVLPGRALLTLKGPFEITLESGAANLDSGMVSCEITPGTKGFSVFSGPWEVKVLGTSFEVSARPGSKELKVAVSKGRVGVVGPEVSLILEQGEWASVSPGIVRKGSIGPNAATDPAKPHENAFMDADSPALGDQKAGAAPAIPDSVQLIAPRLMGESVPGTNEKDPAMTGPVSGPRTGEAAKGSTSSGQGALLETKSGF